MKPLSRFERLAERLVEGTFARLFAGRLKPLEVANALARAMEERVFVGPQGELVAPNRYWVTLHPTDYRILCKEEPALEAELASHVATLAQEAGLALPYPPVITLRVSQVIPPHQVRVEARWEPPAEGEESTREMPLPPTAEVGPAGPMGRPFLIIQGVRHVDLTAPLITLGRSLDNDIIIEDRRVSRHHAQLRRRYGRYIIYDLGSSGGTLVNGYPVQECALQPGDVISLAGVELIYGEDLVTPIPPPRAGDTPGMTDTDQEA